MKLLRSGRRWLTRLCPFGMSDATNAGAPVRFASTPFGDVALDAVWNALNRTSDTRSLEELHRGLSEKDRRPPLAADAKIAFGFDTNAIFRLGLGTQGANALDYLTERHVGPVIIPGQAVQEIWNNFLAGIEPNAKIVSKKLTDLEVALGTITQELGPQGAAAKTAIQALIDSHGDWTDPKALSEFDGTVAALLSVSKVSYVPRDEFYRLGQIRKETKTPPGFRDEAKNFGDYFIWADFLYGVAQADLSAIDAVVLVTNDQKTDWSRNKVPHPVLVSEAQAVAGKEFRLWTLDIFHTFVKSIAS